ncbi:MAG: 3-deoxy-D-manno-octulosonic acid transferase [Alphaproteobacteria bacterium]|nr:3-deoxy-D-manno-octulosonic acid transferase [Alphaproteobacteria bacterium]|tara:strand:+ start:161601 stop:162878 length:1278 start_codon:yes stop_codon:yes gene_type:complete
MYYLYRLLTRLSASAVLKRRLKAGKEDAKRINERMGKASLRRPDGALLWMHGASVGEVTSLITLTKKIKKAYPSLDVLITSGTKTSANLLAQRQMDGVFHQYIPLDHPAWVKNFLDHWAPDAAILAESELWPNLLMSVKARDIPTALVNARLSPKSFKNWSKLKGFAGQMLSTFSVILTQTDEDKTHYTQLGHNNVITAGNIKYSAPPLPYDAAELARLQTKFKDRPIWVYASTHADEEALACRVHAHIKKTLPSVLTLIVPRHPERRDAIAAKCDVEMGAPVLFRSAMATPPENTEIYIADTLGELGLFYRLADIAVIGRTFSNDGGGGHNPLEAAQLGCVTLYGPFFQNLKDIFNEMHDQGAAFLVRTEHALQTEILKLFLDPVLQKQYQDTALNYMKDKADILENTYQEIIHILPPSIKGGA